jgi:membrane-bound lytic murein transglycosylase A
MRALVLLALLVAASCAPKPSPVETPPKPLLHAVTFAEMSGWTVDDHRPALAAFVRSCKTLLAQPADRSLGADGVGGTMSDWHPACTAARALQQDTAGTARAFFESHFSPYALLADTTAAGLFTGYYEAELNGARQKGGAYRTPIHSRPADLINIDLGKFRSEWKGERIAGRVRGGTLEPYESRAEIEAGSLKKRNLEIVWVDDPVDAFFLHIQGSGRVRMDDGSIVRLGYAGHNGHAYVAIGRELVRRGDMTVDQVSMQSIRAWMEAHSERATDLMRANPSYIFFRETEGDGPMGAQGVALTPGRSLAVDRRYVPLGVPVWLDTADPLAPAQPWRHLMVAQDTGGAIKGIVRGDIFFGYGDAAAEQAGRMRQQGRVYLLLPRKLDVRSGLQTTSPGA